MLGYCNSAMTDALRSSTLSASCFFCSWRADAFDVVVGLFVGNLLAVLSWMFLCAPIAIRARLTLYYQLEKICGRNLVTVYNLANGIMFCFLAGSMITVSAPISFAR